VITDPDIPQKPMLETCARLLLSALRWPELSRISIFALQHTAQAGGSCENRDVSIQALRIAGILPHFKSDAYAARDSLSVKNASLIQFRFLLHMR
jgi:hypothetical protein